MKTTARLNLDTCPPVPAPTAELLTPRSQPAPEPNEPTPAGATLSTLQREGEAAALRIGQALGVYLSPEKTPPRPAGQIPPQFQTTPRGLSAVPPQALTGKKAPPSARRYLGSNLQLATAPLSPDNHRVRAAGRFADGRNAFVLADASGAKLVAGKQVNSTGGPLVFIEKNVGHPAYPRFAHGGVMEQKVGDEWCIREHYLPVLSVAQAIRRVGLKQRFINRMEEARADGHLEQFLEHGNLPDLNALALCWTQRYYRRYPNAIEDVKVFSNLEGKLPIGSFSLEFTCRQPDWRRGEMRLVLDQKGHLLFTPNHYRSFVLLTPEAPKRLHLNALPMRRERLDGSVFSPYKLASALLELTPEAIEALRADQKLEEGGTTHPVSPSSSATRQQLGVTNDAVECLDIEDTGVALIVSADQDGRPSVRVFIKDVADSQFSKVVKDKADASDLNYFKV